MAASTAWMSIAANGLNPEVRLPEIDILLLLTAVVEEVRLNVEEGEDDLGVATSDTEELLKL